MLIGAAVGSGIGEQRRRFPADQFGGRSRLMRGIADVEQATLEGFIARLAIHSSLTPAEIDALRELPTRFDVIPAGRDFVRLKEKTDQSYFVVTGIVGRYSQGVDGVRQITALHVPGDMANLCSVVFPRSSWTYQALTKAEVLCVPHAALRDLTRECSGIATVFWRDCVVDISVMSESMMTLSRRRAEAKVAHLLCEISCRQRRAGIVESDRFEWQLRQAQVGEILGLTPVHVNRMFRALREMQLATVSRGTADIHDLPGLAKLAQFDPAYLYIERG